VANELSSLENRLADIFVTLADTLVTGFDVVGLFDDLAGACVDLLDATAAGLMLVDPAGRLRVMASSSERSRLLELLEIQNDEGPCLDCHRSGEPVLVADLAAEDGRWPTFTAEATRVGFGAVYALPMRLREETIGALNLFHRDPHAMSPASLRLAQALADVATIGILQQRAHHEHDQLTDQLQTALTNRLTIEQAKGILAERGNIGVDDAFLHLRDYCRHHRLATSPTAHQIVIGQLNPADILDHIA
jgi:GAF domain-containing protein